MAVDRCVGRRSGGEEKEDFGFGQVSTIGSYFPFETGLHIRMGSVGAEGPMVTGAGRL